jgi:hypothetical protein
VVAVTEPGMDLFVPWDRRDDAMAVLRELG